MKVVCWDLETTDLKAMMGTLLCCAFQEVVPEGFYRNHRGVPPAPYLFKLERGQKDKYDPNPDRTLAVRIRDELEKYNIIVGWNSKMFDAPFLNARLLSFGERPLQPQFHLDLMYYAGGVSNRIGSRKLVNVQKFLKLEDAKTQIEWDVWKAAGLGDPKAMKEVAHHCEMDVKVLGQAYWHLLPYVARLHR